MDELKACPHCGSEDVHVEGRYYGDSHKPTWEAECQTCDYSPNWCVETREEAIKYWNTRFIEDALNQHIEELERASYNQDVYLRESGLTETAVKALRVRVSVLEDELSALKEDNAWHPVAIPLNTHIELMLDNGEVVSSFYDGSSFRFAANKTYSNKMSFTHWRELQVPEEE